MFHLLSMQDSGLRLPASRLPRSYQSCPHRPVVHTSLFTLLAEFWSVPFCLAVTHNPHVCSHLPVVMFRSRTRTSSSSSRHTSLPAGFRSSSSSSSSTASSSRHTSLHAGFRSSSSSSASSSSSSSGCPHKSLHASCRIRVCALLPHDSITVLPPALLNQLAAQLSSRI